MICWWGEEARMETGRTIRKYFTSPDERRQSLGLRVSNRIREVPDLGLVLNDLNENVKKREKSKTMLRFQLGQPSLPLWSCPRLERQQVGGE